MHFNAINPGPPLDRQRLSAYCAEHNLSLPASLLVQLLDQNGGAPRSVLLVKVGDSDNDYTEFASFFGVGMSDIGGELSWNAEILAGRIPAGTCPFADDAGGNVFLIETTHPADGAVWFWDHEREGDAGAAVEIAASLGEFLNSLTPANEIDA